MDITIITKLISIVLAISLASERLVTFLKTIFPYLASPAADPDTGVLPPNNHEERIRQLTVMLIAFLASWLTASFLRDGTFRPFDPYDIGPPQAWIPVWILGLLASGGSAFWTGLLGYVKAARDVNTQKSLQEKMNTAFQSRGAGVNFLSMNSAKSKTALKTIRFTAAFTGGPGNLKIKIDGLPEFEFDKDDFKDVALPGGVTNYTAYGSASPGPGGGATLKVSGDVITNSPQVYGPGIISPNTHAMLI